MCGIFGVITKEESAYSNKFLKKSFITLAKLSETRGKDSSGLCILNPEDKTYQIYKGAFTTGELFNKREVTSSIQNIFKNNNYVRLAFGHARLVTNGTQLNTNNNQPIIKDDIIGIHNGIITNVDELWDEYDDISKENEIDTDFTFFD